MNRWFTIVCILGIFAGAAHSAYWPLTVGGNVLKSIGDSLKTISTTLAAYNTALEKARNQIYNAAISLLTSMNSTYLTLNKTYSILDPTYNTTILSVVATLQPQLDMVKQFDLSMVSYIQRQIYVMQEKVAHVISSLLQSPMQVVHMGMGYSTANKETCAQANATQLQAANVSISRYATCLSSQTTILATIAPIAANLLQYGLVDYNLLTKQISLCTTAGLNLCTSTYFASVSSELSTITSELYFAGNFLNQIANVLSVWITYCAGLTEVDIFDIYGQIDSKVRSCMWDLN